MQGIFQKENTDKALKYGIYRHLPTYEKIIRNLVSFYIKKSAVIFNSSVTNHGKNGTNCKKHHLLTELLFSRRWCLRYPHSSVK